MLRKKPYPRHAKSLETITKEHQRAIDELISFGRAQSDRIVMLNDRVHDLNNRVKALETLVSRM